MTLNYTENVPQKVRSNTNTNNAAAPKNGRKKGNCFNCNKPGHHPKDCRAPKRVHYIKMNQSRILIRIRVK